MNRTTAAKLIESAASKRGNLANSSYARRRELIEMYRQDEAKLKMISSFLRQNMLCEAWWQANHLDAGVRDLIPEDVWKYLQFND